jgi:multidrug efflux pump subunit AcrB
MAFARAGPRSRGPWFECRKNSSAVEIGARQGAGTERLRPILMTTFAAVDALLPLAAGFGSGSEMLIPLAIGVIGGLSTATAFTLVLIPVLYAAYAGDRAR